MGGGEEYGSDIMKVGEGIASYTDPHSEGENAGHSRGTRKNYFPTLNSPLPQAVCGKYIYFGSIYEVNCSKSAPPIPGPNLKPHSSSQTCLFLLPLFLLLSLLPNPTVNMKNWLLQEKEWGNPKRRRFYYTIVNLAIIDSKSHGTKRPIMQYGNMCYYTNDWGN